MPDMIVKLYGLPGLDIHADRMQRLGVEIRRPNPWERALLLDWVRRNFTETWAAECKTAFAATPPSCYVAVEADALIGFACYDCTRKNFFGPTGVAEAARGRGVGLSLLLACLHAMRDGGYAYAIIGGVGPAEYYAKTVGAALIEGSSPGIYDFGLLRKTQEPDSRT